VVTRHYDPLLEKITAWMFRHRTPLVCGFGVLTAVMAWFAVHLKVDASFVRDLPTNPGNQTFLKGLTHIAHSIGMLVIAEGVTSAAELYALKGVDFDGATGPAIK